MPALRPGPAAAVAAAARALAAWLALAACAEGCGEERPPPQYRLTFEVVSDGSPLPGAQVLVRERLAGQTDASGTVRLSLAGRDGLQVPVTVRCPAGTRSPAAPVEVTLRTVQAIDRAAAARGLVQRVDCPPEDRTLAVVIRASGGANLPVLWQGREVSRTDAHGVAHLSFRVRPSSQLALALATNAQPSLRPQNPTRQFAVNDADDVVVWDPEFRGEAPPPRAARPRSGPVRRRGPLPLR